MTDNKIIVNVTEDMDKTHKTIGYELMSVILTPQMLKSLS